MIKPPGSTGCFRFSCRAINLVMPLKDDLKAYQARWADVEAFVSEEQRTASLDLRWRQLNAAYGLAKGLGLILTDQTETEVFERWATLKKKATSQLPKT
jgi:hypothetical protein